MNDIRYSKTTELDGIKMTLIGTRSDLGAYYRGADGNVWFYSACTRRWSNWGSLDLFLPPVNFKPV